MKLRIGDKVYLQKYEVSFIEELKEIPAVLYDELYKFDEGARFGYFSVNGVEDGCRFAVCFKKPESIKWLMEQEWIVDYDYYSQMSAPEVDSICWKLTDEFHRKLEKLGRSPNEELDKLSHQIWSLGIMADHLRGKQYFQFPLEMVKKPTKKPGFFARLFGRSVH